MQELVIASNNKGKINEIKALLSHIRLLTLEDIGFYQDIPEPYHSFEQNALIKAETIHQYCGKNVFADDSGLCVNALGGEPGVQSAYYGGLPRSDEKNNEQLLLALETHKDRSAFYKAVICLIWNGSTYFFEGICEGTIQNTPAGSAGFGYDPLFVPSGFNRTFAELPVTVKNDISHRGKAIRQMSTFLQDQLSAA